VQRTHDLGRREAGALHQRQGGVAAFDRAQVRDAEDRLEA
jgi:hypothetical protein